MMRMSLLFAITFLFLSKNRCFAIDLEYIRSHYQKAVSDKKLCETMIAELEKNKNDNIELAYLGAFQAIWAKHISNPISKITSFYRAKANIEKAVRNEKNNIEIRFVRLSVQKNCPAFLGYNTNLQEDERFLRENMKNISSKELLNMVEKILNS